MEAPDEHLSTKSGDATAQLILQAEGRLSPTESKRISILQTKHQLRDDMAHWRKQYDNEAAQCKDLSRRLDEQESENVKVKDQLRDARSRVQDGHKEKQRLERLVQDLRTRKPSLPESPQEAGESPTGDVSQSRSAGATGLREFKLGRADTIRSQTSTTFSKRTSSLNIQPVLATENNELVGEDALLLELVNAKTAEAVARQELEEVKGKLDSLRKMLGGSAASPSHRASPSEATALPFSPGLSSNPGLKTPSESPRVTPTGNGGGGFFSGWGKRSVS